MTLGPRTSRALAVACALAGLIVLPQTASAAGGPCALLTPTEIEQVVGQKVPALKASGPGMCSGSTTGFTLLLRLAQRTGGDTGMEDKAMAMVKRMGGQVELKTFGPMTCSTVVPPANLVQAMGFNTTCSILKSGWVAAVEVSAKSQRDQVSIEKLRPLAEKMNSRF